MSREVQVRAQRDPVISGYAHAGVVTRPWIVYVHDAPLLDQRGRVRRFASEAAALAAGSLAPSGAPSPPTPPMDPSRPSTVSDVELAFPAHVLGTLLPAWESIPDEFRGDRSPWCRIAQQMFMGVLDVTVRPRAGIDPVLAGRHLAAVLRSYQPKHQHKIAGIAYLLSLWFELEAPDIAESSVPAEGASRAERS